MLKLTITDLISMLNLSDQGLYQEVWKQFVQWSFFQFQSERHIHFGRIGHYGYKVQERSHKKIPFLFFDDNYLKQIKLIPKIRSNFMKPLVKINYIAIAKHLQDFKITKQEVQEFLSQIIEEIQKIISDIQIQAVKIDLNLMGCISRQKNQIWFDYLIPNKEKNLMKNNAKVTLRNIIEQEEGRMTKNKFQIGSSQNKQLKLPKLDKKFLALNQKPIRQRKHKMIHDDHGIRNNDSEFRQTSAIDEQQQSKVPVRSISLQSLKSRRKLSSRYQQSSEKRKPNQSLGWQMMGAGQDPLKKETDYARLTSNISDLLKTQFKFPIRQAERSVPIIDVFARTLACPIATQRQNPLVAARIGSNLSLATQRFMITYEGMKYFNENIETLNKRIKSVKVHVLNQNQEYVITTLVKRTKEQQNLLKAKKQNYQRYLKIFGMIDDKHLLELSKDLLQRIFDKIDQKFQKPQLLQPMIQQLNESYKKAIRKSIVDYILLDPIQQDRLQVYIKFKPVIYYGKARYNYPRKNEISIIKQLKPFFQQNLIKTSKNIQKIQAKWLQKYQHLDILQLPQKLKEFLTIQQFIDRQAVSLKDIKQSIINVWIPEISQIYKVQISEMGRNRQKCELFFDSTSMLLFIQIRTLINKGFQSYLNFFSEYNQQILNPPDTVVHLQRTQGKYQACFLSVRLSHKKDQIYFMDNLQEIQMKFLSIIDKLRQFASGIPRPQNMITKTDKHYLIDIPEDDQMYLRVRQKVQKIIRKNLANTNKCLGIYNDYAYLLNQVRVIDKWVTVGNHDRRQYSLIFIKYQQLYDRILEEIPFFIRLNMVIVDSSELKRYFLKILNQVIERIEKSAYDLVFKKNEQIYQQLQKMVQVASSHANTCERLVEVETSMENYRRNQIKNLQNKEMDLIKWIGITLYSTLHPINQDDLKTLHQTSQFLINIHKKLDEYDSKIFEYRKTLEDEAKSHSKYLTQKIKKMARQMEKLKDYGNKFLKDSAIELINECRKQINQFKAELKELSHRQKLLGIDQTDPHILNQADLTLKPFEELWTLVKNHQNSNQAWTRQSIFTQDADMIGMQAKVMYKAAVALSNNHVIKKYAPLSVNVAIQLYQDIQKFQKNIPLMAVFSNPGLKQRHFQQINRALKNNNEPLNRNSNLTLNKLLGMGASECIQQLEVISESASKEYMIETTLAKINKQWQTVQLQTKNYKQTETQIVTGAAIEECQTLLDDHSLKIITMKGSIFAKTFEKELQNIESWVNYSNELIQYTTKVQSVWMYLQPVMTSPDILKHLSVEGSKFRIVDEVWKEITSKYKEFKLVQTITKNRSMLQKLKDCHDNLEIVQKGLNSYLQSKRVSFPRFFFLSNEQLLQILSQTKDPTRVQPHLKKCFEGISRLQFEDRKHILGMYSDQQQYVHYTSSINTALARGNVDEWLLQVEQRMILSIKREIEQSHKQYQEKARRQCLLSKCAMAVLTVQMTNWTKMVQNCIVQEGLEEGVRLNRKLLDQTVNLIKTPNLKKVNVMTLQALIVLSVHNLDIAVNLHKNQVKSTANFNWESQLRYYFIEPKNKDCMVTEVRILNATCAFNHQYLGNTSRLVITPLTDRCYRTLCSAIYLNYGGAPQGPAGTGKTETVKDLAKALACQCVVFNCSDGLDYKAMGKFFKGLAASGAWSCFDQFNRINLEVLSVVAQQILCIQVAKANNQSSLIFEDAQLSLKSSANCFITMNPGYAGRSQLPDNLKALFRAVAMMIPDYAMIAEISLYSYGFSDARNLARKIVTTYKLCSEQLSSQQHYDYGMRAVKSVLVAAGNLKRNYADIQQNALILKAINDVNVAKFLAFDIPLFSGITSDLFPEVQPPKINYQMLIQAIESIFKQKNLCLKQYAVDKIIQIYDMILVRHGLMVVGYPFAGKTTALEVLAQALGRVKQEMNQKSVQICKINPKSITMRHLYGYFDQVSHEWFDGVLAVKFRNLASSISPSRKWLLLDGPVDAIWIQNMNTVLDDNKKLCLNSGQIIAMSRTMSLIFQPMDLLAASPATVSRCGMIYLEPASLGHQVFFEAWLQSLTWASPSIIILLKQFSIMIEPMYKQIQQLKTICFTTIFNLLQCFFRLMNFKLEVVKEAAQKRPQLLQQLEDKIKYPLIGQCFIFALVWSFGGVVTTQGRKIFDSKLKRYMLAQMNKNSKRKLNLPDKGTLFDYKHNINQDKFGSEWVKWIDVITLQHEQQKANSTPIAIHEIIVKTSDIVKYDFLVNICIKDKLPLLLCGPTGTGKTTLIKNFYSEKLNHKQTGFLEIIFSSKTACYQVQDQIQIRMDKRGSKSVLGPKNNPKMLIFVDDLNMPVKQFYGAQPPIEFLRQLLDQGGFYDLKQKQKIFKKTIDVMYMYSMAATNNQISPRFLRHLSILSVTNFDEETMNRIFSTILSISFHDHSEQKQTGLLLKYSIQLYDQCVKNLLPTPAKSHYLFNLRDLWKLIIGVCRANKQKVHSENIGRLWAHEVKRIFRDRLLPSEKPFIDQMIKSIGQKWGKNMNSVYFSDILSLAGQKSYQQINDLQKINLATQTALNNYNMVSDKPMDLVLFSYALEHILIVLRIVRQPRGNALLVGMGGSGRKSFANLGSFIAEYNTFTLEITKSYNFQAFRQDMKKLFIEIGVKNKFISFVLSDGQIKQQQFLEDVNNLLNIGNVPNLFTTEQKVQIVQNTRRDAVEAIGGQASFDKIYTFFQNRVKDQLRVILCFSPIGDSFRTRLRMFPSLVNCTTIDWYEQWPKEGLISVAQKFLSRVQLNNKANFIEMFEYLHSNTKEWTLKIREQLKRTFYVTPTSYIQFITTFKNLLTEKRKEVKKLIFKYENGYNKIIQTERAVENMKKNLQEMKPQLAQAAAQTTTKMQLVANQKIQADSIMNVIQEQQAIVINAVNQANVIKEDCQNQLAVALPQLKAAQKALLVLDKSSISELKAMKSPPETVKLTLQALCLIIDPNPKQRVKNEKTMKMQVDWWSASVRNIANPKILNDLVTFDKDTLTEGLVTNLGKFLQDPNNKNTLHVANVAKASVACQCIIQWVNGMYNFYFVDKKIKPKKESLKQAQIKVGELNKKLQYKRRELDQANGKVTELKYELQWAQKNKQRLQTEYKNCEIGLSRASIIIKNLASEKIRWHDLSQEYKKEEQKVDSNVFMASAQITYLGPFTPAFRANIAEKWIYQFNQHDLKINKNFMLTKFLGDPIKIREWNMNGLPYDNFSLENALIMKNSRRWPLMIDPQGQANKWLKKQQAARKLKIIKLSDDNFIRNLENCIQFGTPVLIQNLGQQISAALNPILLKQTYKKGATTYLKMGQNVLIYSNDFYLYMTTKLRNPHFLPETCTQVVMINFMITEEGLSDQLLALLVSKQRPQLEEQKTRLVLQSSENQKVLKQIEDQILDILNNAENILDDQKAINVLSASKQKSNEISQKQQLAEQTELQIDKARSQYVDVSKEGSLMFFVLTDLANIDSMYQYSLTYFTDLFSITIQTTPKSDKLQSRLQDLRKYFKINLFRNISRSLFQKDRLMFSALMALRLSQISPDALRFLLLTSIPAGKSISIDKPKGVHWITDKMWMEISKLSEIKPYQDLTMLINEQINLKILQDIVEDISPFTKILPSVYQSIPFEKKLLLYKCLRPQKMIEGFTLLVEQILGKQFTKSLPFDLSQIYPDSNVQTPLLFILSPGADPFISVQNYSRAKNINLESISLGQGQGPIAQRLIRTNFQKGGWVVLQNCHLAVSWMTSLQKIVQQLQQNHEIHKDFRIWLTSYPTQTFPQSVLQKALKITNEPPKGLKNNLMMSFLADPVNDSQFFQSSLHAKPFKKLLYSLCMFHAVVQERRKFGPLGWNISYQFTQSDLRISCRQLKIYVDSMSNSVPFEALKYLIAQCNYGGRVTDQNDRRLLQNLLQDFFNDKVINDSYYNFGNSLEYVLPDTLIQHADYIRYIQTLPNFGSPQLVGLHSNADITKDINESNTLLDALLSCSSSSSVPKKRQGKTQEDQILDMIHRILDEKTFPYPFDLQKILQRYPVLYEQSMNTVLNQQLARYNKLLNAIKTTLNSLQKAIKGQSVMSADLQKMFKAMYEGKVPQLWMAKSYPSLKPLASYIDDLLKRVKFFNEWVKNGIPQEFWISGFFFTQSFLTGVLQNYSRRKKIPVDQLAFQFIFQKKKMGECSDGANIYGLFIQGARWDSQKQVLAQSKPRQLFVQCPNIYLKPNKASQIEIGNVYETPLYKTLLRRGILSTTGHSTNFVMMVRTPSDRQSSHWTKRGVAFLTQMSS